MTGSGHEPITATESEQSALSMIEALLKTAHFTPKLVGARGEEIELPRSVFLALRQLVCYLIHDQAITVVPLNKNLTTQEAADILNISRPYLIKLLEQGEILFTKTGTHRRIRLRDLMEYKHARDAERRREMTELTQFSQDLGMYNQ